jgi:hypothetical protein
LTFFEQLKKPEKFKNICDKKYVRNDLIKKHKMYLINIDKYWLIINSGMGVNNHYNNNVYIYFNIEEKYNDI